MTTTTDTISIYEIGTNAYWTGESKTIGIRSGAPAGWTRSTPPTKDDPSLGYSVWVNSKWSATINPPYVPPPIVISLEEMQSSKRASITAARKIAEEKGFLWVYPTDGKTYFIDTTESSQNKLKSIRSAAQEGLRKAGDVWKCYDVALKREAFLPLTNDEVIALSLVGLEMVQTYFNQEGALNDLVNAATTEEELAAIEVKFVYPVPEPVVEPTPETPVEEEVPPTTDPEVPVTEPTTPTEETPTTP